VKQFRYPEPFDEQRPIRHQVSQNSFMETTLQSSNKKMSFHHHQEGNDLCAIFVHAGAGYHSHANEKHYLMAVEDASKVAMALLQNGGDAVDAVEMAIKLLEDREITNAGYGSNLTMSGEVECDATMVDHFGRSGAVGAVSRECRTSISPPLADTLQKFGTQLGLPD
jgi:Asparaginase